MRGAGGGGRQGEGCRERERQRTKEATDRGQEQGGNGFVEVHRAGTGQCWCSAAVVVPNPQEHHATLLHHAIGYHTYTLSPYLSTCPPPAPHPHPHMHTHSCHSLSKSSSSSPTIRHVPPEHPTHVTEAEPSLRTFLEKRLDYRQRVNIHIQVGRCACMYVQQQQQQHTEQGRWEVEGGATADSDCGSSDCCALRCC